MAPFVTTVLLVCMGLFFLAILFELSFTRKMKPALIELAMLIIIFVVLSLTTGFPKFPVSSGNVLRSNLPTDSTTVSLIIICLGTIFGIAAHYFFYLKGKFSWQAFLKPLFISPLIILPLVGTIQGNANLNAIQLISTGILAFQNGFFWKTIFDKAKSSMENDSIRKPVKNTSAKSV